MIYSKEVPCKKVTLTNTQTFETVKKTWKNFSIIFCPKLYISFWPYKFSEILVCSVIRLLFTFIYVMLLYYSFHLSLKLCFWNFYCKEYFVQIFYWLYCTLHVNTSLASCPKTWRVWKTLFLFSFLLKCFDEETFHVTVVHYKQVKPFKKLGHFCLNIVHSCIFITVNVYIR